MLFPIEPKARGTSARRALFVSEELWNVLSSPEGSPDWEQRMGELRADLEVFAAGYVIDPKYLFLLYPATKGIWEIRSTRESPSIRVLGGFAGHDTFIATNFALRIDLGGWQSREWKEVKRTAQAKWRTLFHTYQPMKGTDLTKFVSGALNGKYFKDAPAK